MIPYNCLDPKQGCVRSHNHIQNQLNYHNHNCYDHLNHLKPGEVPLLSDGDPEVEACKPLVRRDVHCVLVHTCEYHYHCDNYDDYGDCDDYDDYHYD